MAKLGECNTGMVGDQLALYRYGLILAKWRGHFSGEGARAQPIAAPYFTSFEKVLVYSQDPCLVFIAIVPHNPAAFRSPEVGSPGEAVSLHVTLTHEDIAR
jgi:hypothetical protein